MSPLDIVEERFLLGRRVLIIDDDPNFIAIFRKMLKRFGANCIEAPDTIRALEMILNAKVDLVFLDVNLSFEDGMEFLRTLKDNPETTGVPVVMVSSDSSKDSVLNAMTRGASDYVVKPVVMETLVQKIKRILGDRGFLRLVAPPNLWPDCQIATSAAVTALTGTGLQMVVSCSIKLPAEVEVFGGLSSFLFGSTPKVSLKIDAAVPTENGSSCTATFQDRSQLNQDKLQLLIGKEIPFDLTQPSEEISEHGEVVCILDDDVNSQKLLERVVAHTGYPTKTFSQPEELLKFLRYNSAKACLIDLCIEDQRIGLQVIQAIRRVKGNSVRLFVVSAEERVAIIAEAMEMGCDDYIFKSRSYESMCQIVQTNLSKTFPELPTEEVAWTTVPIWYRAAEIAFKAKLIEADELGITFWCRQLIHKGNKVTLKCALLQEGGWLNEKVMEILEFRVMTTEVHSLAGESGFRCYAESVGEYEGYQSFLTSLKGFLEG